MELLPSARHQLPALHSIAKLHSELKNRYGIRGLFIGLKRRDGEFTGRSAVVVIVDKKLPKCKLSRGACIPRKLGYSECNTNTKQRTIQTDVLQKYGSIRQQAFFNPGDIIRGKSSAGNSVHATIGAFGLHVDFGPVFVTAGHFSSQIDRRKKILVIDRSTSPARELAGKIVKTARANGTDYALLKPNGPLPGANLGNVPVSSVYNPILAKDIGQPLFVLARGEQIPTTCRGLYMTYKNPASGEVFFNLIVTDCVTQPGDSGAALVDENYRLWGFVIGAVRFRNSSGGIDTVSIYMPAIRLLSLETLTVGDSL